MTNEKAIEYMENLCVHDQDICDCKMPLIVPIVK